MSSILDRRFLCVLGVCRCRRYYLTNPNREIPSSPSDLCEGCMHPWITHLVSALPADDPNAFYNRGGTDAFTCGGYYSPQSPATAATLPPCVCGVSFSEHYDREDFDNALRARAPRHSQALNVNSQTAQLTASTSTIPPIPASSTSISSMPVLAWPSPAAATVTSTAANTQAPVSRSSTPSGLGLAPPPPVVPGYTTSSSQIPSLFSRTIPHPIAAFAPSMPPTTIEQSRTASLSRMHAANTIASAGGTGNRNVSYTVIDVGILPFNGVDRVSGFSAPFSIMNDNRPNLFRVLQAHGLIVQVSWAVGSPPRTIFTQLARSVKRALDDGGYRQDGTVFDTSEYENQGWQILQQKHRYQKYALHKPRAFTTTSSFAERVILSLTKHHPLEDSGTQGFLIVAPKQGLMKAPLEGHISSEETPLATARGQPHACISKWILRGVPLADTFFVDEHDTGCLFLLCPADKVRCGSTASTSSTLATGVIMSNSHQQESNRLVRNHSTAFGLEPVLVHNRPRLEDAVAVAHPPAPSESTLRITMEIDRPAGVTPVARPPMEIDSPVTVVATLPANPIRRRFVPWPPLLHKVWTIFITHWHELVKKSVPHTNATIQLIEIKGHNPTAIAQHLVSAIRQRRHEVLEPGYSEEFKIPDFVWESNADDAPLSTLVPLKSTLTNFTICPSPTSKMENQAIGSGPQLAVFRSANIAIFDNLQYWTAGRYGNQGHLPNYSGADEDLMTPRTMAEFETAGHVLALTMLQVGQVVLVNSWLLTALLAGPDSIFVTLPALQQLDPALANEVAPWYNFDYLGGATVNDVFLNGIFVEVYNSTANMILERPCKRSEANHKRITMSILLHYTLGSKKAAQQPEFKAMQRGFDVLISPGIKLCKLTQDNGYNASLPIHDLDHHEKVDPRRMVYAMMNRKVGQVSEVTSLIDYYPQNAAGIFNREEGYLADTLVEIVQGRVVQYLWGSGHPSGCVGTTAVSAEEAENVQGDKLLRSRLLLESLTGSDLLPISDRKPLKVYVNVLTPLDFSHCVNEEEREAMINAEEVKNSPKIRVCFSSLTFSTTRHFLNLVCSYNTDDAAASLAAFDTFIHSTLCDRSTFNMM